MSRMTILFMLLLAAGSASFSAAQPPLGFSDKQVVFYGRIYFKYIDEGESTYVVEVRECFWGKLTPGEIIHIKFTDSNRSIHSGIFDNINPEDYVGKEVVMVCQCYTKRRKTVYGIDNFGDALFLKLLPMMNVTGRPQLVSDVRSFMQMLKKHSMANLLSYIESKKSPSNLRQAGMFIYIYQLYYKGKSKSKYDEIKKTLASWRYNPDFPVGAQLTVERLSYETIPEYRNSEQRIEFLKKYASCSDPELSQWCIRILCYKRSEELMDFLKKLSPDRLPVLGRLALDEAFARNNPQWINSKERVAMLMKIASSKLDKNTALALLSNIYMSYDAPVLDAKSREAIFETFVQNEKIPSKLRCRACSYLGDIPKTPANQKSRYKFLFSVIKTSKDVSLKDTAAETLKKLTPFSQTQMIQLYNFMDKCDRELIQIIEKALNKSDAEIKQSATAPAK